MQYLTPELSSLRSKICNSICICLDLEKGTSRIFWQHSHLRLVQYLTKFFPYVFSTKNP